MKPLPPEKQHLAALFEAYVEASGLRITLSPSRERTLREFDRRGIAPADVRWVLTTLKGRVERGVPGYTAASLEWGNAMADVDRFEDRLATLRTTRERRLTRERAAAHPAAPVSSGAAPTASTSAGDADAIRNQVKQLAADWRRQLLTLRPASDPPGGRV